MKKWNQPREKKAAAFVMVLLLVLFLAYASLPFIQGFFGALILATFFFPFFQRLQQQNHFSAFHAALLVVAASILIILIPLAILGNFLYGEVIQLTTNPNALADYAEIVRAVSDFTGTPYRLDTDHIRETIQQQFVTSIPMLTDALINLALLFVLFYYFLVRSKDIHHVIFSVTPFSKKNTERLIVEFKKVTDATFVATGILALVMGVMLAAGFLFLGIPYAVLFGVLGFALSFLPILGAGLIWGGGIIYYYIIGDLGKVVGLVILGIAMTVVETVAKIFIQKKVGELHPLISFGGAFIGISFFGPLGIILGPFLFSFLLLFVKMFIEEYL